MSFLNCRDFVGRCLRLDRKRRLAVVGLVWACVVLGGFWVIAEYEVRPAEPSSAPAVWPSESRIHRSATVATLLMFVHPRCPCSRASVAELQRIVEQQTEQAAVHVLFIRPAGVADDWADTALVQSAAEIPGVAVREDVLGWEARLFAAETSGQTLIYDAAGRLAFSGGITAARGHYGANPASDKVLSLLRSETSDGRSDVFGCPLRSPLEPRCELQP